MTRHAMPSHSRFRLATFLTLGVACACLGYAESILFAEIGVLAALTIVFLAALYSRGKRMESLSIRASNRLGVGIFLLYTGWFSYRVLREIRLTEYVTLGWQLLTLPLFSPILILAIPAKLLRDGKNTRDWWSLHAIGLAAIAVAATMADEPIVFVLMGLYAVLGLWCLAEFYRERMTNSILPAATENARPSLTPLGVDTSKPGRVMLRGLLWGSIATAIAVPLFVVTPRSSSDKLEFGKSRIEIGFASTPMIDLRQTGNLEDNPDPVFEVMAEYLDGRPKTDLSPMQRWRGTIFSKYDRGVWLQERYPLPTAANGPTIPGQNWSPPDFGPETYRLSYTMLIEERSSFLADPVMWVDKQPTPVASVCPNGLSGWSSRYEGSGSFTRPQCGPPRATRRKYVQYRTEGLEADLGPEFQMVSPTVKPEDHLKGMLANYPHPVRDYADDLLERLVREQRLPSEAAQRVSPELGSRRLPRHHEAIARAFASHLSADPAFRYSTQLQRVQADVDPIVEFLRDHKTGHCERFAAALVMMLRSQGIPAVIVLGFRGSESLADGHYIIRQRDAHAWVEVLISRPRQGIDAGEPGAEWHWLSLDPVPERSIEQKTAADQATFWTRMQTWINSTFLHYFVNYTPERREQALRQAVELLTDPIFLTSLACGIGVVVAIRKMLRRYRNSNHAKSSEPTQWFLQLFEMLAKHGFTQQPCETAREFAGSVSKNLRDHIQTAHLAAVPTAWVDAYYRARFGGTTIEAENLAELQTSLERLSLALRETKK